MELIKTEEGFTLLEIIISLAIILILVLAFSSGMINSFRIESRVDQRVEAIRIIDSIVEILRVNKGDFENINNNWDRIEDDINNAYSIGDENSSSDIKIEVSNDNNLYLFKIEWTDRNYNTEVLLAGD